MKDLPKNYEFIQNKYTSSSRGTRMGRRVAKNVTECAQYLKPPVLVVGCGDGFEIECLAQSLKIDAVPENILGIEVTSERVETAKAYNLPVVLGAAENIPEIVGDKKYNIYCVHTLEHCFDKKLVIENFKKVALDTIVIIVPIEVRGTKNRAHFSPIKSMGHISNCFGMDWKVINLSYRWNIEPESLLVLKRDPMNWPKRSVRSSELIELGVY